MQFSYRKNAIILLSRILVPPPPSSSVACQGKTTTIPLEKGEESNGDGAADQHHPSTDTELITGVIGGVLDLLKVRRKFYWALDMSERCRDFNSLSSQEW